MPRCRARTQHGYGPLCTQPVKEPHQRCRDHKGLPEAPPRLRKPRRRSTSTARTATTRPTTGRRRTSAHRSQSPVTARQAAAQAAAVAKRKKRVEDAATFCAELLTDGWQKTVENKAAEYVGERTLRRLSRRRRRHCKLLAKFAADVLAGKKWAHDVVGSLVQWLVSLLGGNWFVQVLARKLASKLPLPWDAKLIAVSRGIQIIGVFLCVANDRDITKCQCFIDLAVEETKTRVKQILATAFDDWTELKNFPLKSRTSTA